ncbi:MAG: hypothetical protein Q8R95_15945, partial [Azonexus sp.]|nr:hypothetical protein [Azonexus sp.]
AVMPFGILKARVSCRFEKLALIAITRLPRFARHFRSESYPMKYEPRLLAVTNRREVILQNAKCRQLLKRA